MVDGFFFGAIEGFSHSCCCCWSQVEVPVMMIHNGELLEWIRMMSELQWIKWGWKRHGVEGNYAPEK